jgi:hypothetical protein
MEKLQPNNSQLCIIDNESLQRNTLSSFLRNKGYNIATLEPDGLKNGKIDEVRELSPVCYVIGEEIPLQENAYNVVLLKETNQREYGLPISPKQIANTLDEGADFVAERTIEPVVLEAHIAAILRRERPVQKPECPPLRKGDVIIDVQKFKITREGAEIPLTSTEAALLRTLVQSPGQTISPSELSNAVWGCEDQYSIRNLRSFILKIRKKIEPDPSSPQIIKSQRNIGYKLE